MNHHADILDERDSLRGPLAGSVVLHIALAASAVFYYTVGNRARVLWGSPTASGGGAMGVNIVKQIPLPSRSGVVNPVANDTESAAPEAKPEVKPKPRVEPPEPDAIALKSRNPAKKPSEMASAPNRWREKQQDRPNQVYSSSGQALTSPMYGLAGSGGIGIGTPGTFGNRFGGYVDLLKNQIAGKWRTSEIDPRIQTAPPVIVTFTLMRDGQTRDIRVIQSSGNIMLDRSAVRAIADATPLPPLPAGYDRDSAQIDIHFQLRR